MSDKKPISRQPANTPLDWLAVLFATGFGSGYSPVAPGTAGTIVAVPIYYLLTLYLQLNLAYYITIVLIITLLGCVAAERAGKHFGVVDAQQIVIDEIAGFLIAMTATTTNFLAVVLGFTLFRVCDILKPWPASYFDRHVANGFGVVMDDVMAGLYTLFFLQLLNYFRLFG